MQNVLLPAPSKCLSIWAVTLTGWRYQTTASSALITAGLLLPTGIGKDDNEIKKMTLDAHEFIRRFLLHVLPKGLMKIRYFGFLSHSNKKEGDPAYSEN